MPKLILQGIAASGGSARGKVKIIHTTDDSSSFQEGDILVARITDPTMVAIMAKSAAIVCDVGRITSHPSIVSRELGIPCIVNTQKGTEMLRDGMEVFVDGDKGEVYLEE